MAIFWTVVLTGLFALAVATIVSGKRRRQQIADLYANPGAHDAVLRSQHLHSFQRERGPGPDPI